MMVAYQQTSWCLIRRHVSLEGDDTMCAAICRCYQHEGISVFRGTPPDQHPVCTDCETEGDDQR